MGSTLVVSVLPESADEVGVLCHELGHAVRARKRRNNPDQIRTYSEAYNKFEDAADRKGFVSENEEGLSAEEVRKIKVAEERGAWATGLSLVREVGKTIDLDVSSTENVGEMIRRSETALRTYDEVPYKVTKQTEDQPVPSFSREMRKAARELRKEIKRRELKYKDLSNFDEVTGEAIGGNTKKQIEKINKNP